MTRQRCCNRVSIHTQLFNDVLKTLLICHCPPATLFRMVFRQCCSPSKCWCFAYRKITWHNFRFLTACPGRSADCAAVLRCLRVLGGIRCRQRSQHYLHFQTALHQGLKQ
jgi:hypothetical protein